MIKKQEIEVVLDLETTIVEKFKRKANPFVSDNWIVMSGWKKFGKTEGIYFNEPSGDALPDLTGITIIVGHNIKFDLLYLWKHPRLIAFFERGGKIWDTQLAEYILGCMQKDVQMNSLNDCAVKYGGTVKLDAVKEMWNKGINTPDIPEDILTDYLLGNPDEGIAGDIENTWIVYKSQLLRASQQGDNVINNIESRMDSLLMSTEMEFNGIEIDEQLGEELRQEQAVNVEVLFNELKGWLPEGCEDFNWGSVYQKSAFLFGGVVVFSKRVPKVIDGVTQYCKMKVDWNLCEGIPYDPRSKKIWDRYKSGKRAGEVKTKKVDVFDKTKPKFETIETPVYFTGHVKPKDKWQGNAVDSEGNPIYSTGNEVIQEIIDENEGDAFCTLLSKYVAAKKDLGTYFWVWANKAETSKKGMLTLVHDGIIHHKLNHTSTLTGRLSSNDPNGQNIPRRDKSKVKQLFTCKGGKIIEIDYKQLEIVGQAINTDDPNLIKEIKDGVDAHSVRLALMMGITYPEVLDNLKGPDAHHWEELRVKAKGFSFMRAFGAGARHIASKTGLDIEVVKALIAKEEIHYNRVTEFDNEVADSIMMTSEKSRSRILVGEHWVHPKTGRFKNKFGQWYAWTEHPAPEWLQESGKLTAFSPTERKNYPTQGLGGQLVQEVMGQLFRWRLRQHNRELIKFSNTVHDCFWIRLYVEEEQRVSVIKDICDVMVSLRRWCKERFNVEIPVDFRVDAKMGDNLYDLESVKFD